MADSNKITIDKVEEKKISQKGNEGKLNKKTQPQKKQKNKTKN